MQTTGVPEIDELLGGLDADTRALMEDRPSKIFDFLCKLGAAGNGCGVTKIVSIHGMSDGFTALVRLEDGNAYEVQVRPAKYSQSHQKNTKQPTARRRADATMRAAEFKPPRLFKSRFDAPKLP